MENLKPDPWRGARHPLSLAEAVFDSGCRAPWGAKRPPLLKKKEDHMTRQDIEAAIQSLEGWLNVAAHPVACKTLIQVAKAWLETEDWIKAGGNIQIVPARLLKHMERLLNPPPKTNLEKVREWADKHQVPTPGRWFRYEDRGELRALLDQLEDEKENS